MVWVIQKRLVVNSLQSITKNNMNIRKKILFNPSHIKSFKPDTSDNTTANTKNSAVWDQSKTFKLPNNNVFSTRRQRNYLRTISKELKPQQLTDNHNLATSAIKKRTVLPSFSTLSNQNYFPSKKGIQVKRFLLEPEELPSLVPLKRTEILSHQNPRRLLNFPSSVHCNSNKEIFNPRQNSIKQSQQQVPQPAKNEHNILGNNIDDIERRRQKLNSMNVESFYTTQKSIGLSKFSLGSRQCIRNKILEKKNVIVKENKQYLSIEKQRKLSKFEVEKKEQNLQEELRQEQEAGEVAELDIDESLQQQIAEQIQIQRNRSKAIERLQESQEPQRAYNQWSATLKSSFTDSKEGEFKEEKSVKNQPQEDSDLSLCESEEIDSRLVAEKKRTCRGTNPSGNHHSKQQAVNQCINNQNNPKTYASQESSLCESYQIQTPKKNIHSPNHRSN